MSRLHGWIASILATACATQAVAQAPISVSPRSHDFGRIAVAATSLVGFTVGGVQVGDTVFARITGPDAGDWVLHASTSSFGSSPSFSPCDSRARFRAGTCGGFVVFFPASVGTKRAQMQVVASGGRMATMDLTGTAVAPLCTHTVVPCNYAHLYDGTFSWRIHLQGQAGSDELGLQVAITAGKAECTGTQVSRTADGGSWTGSIVGPGLLGVEFVSDPMYPLAYRITVACPSARFPDHADGSKGRASQPAELGTSYSIETDRQPARVAGEPLSGALTYPAPETDPANGVSGAVSVQWNLWRTGQPPPPPPGGPAARGPR